LSAGSSLDLPGFVDTFMLGEKGVRDAEDTYSVST
jgi:hypothetical protein